MRSDGWEFWRLTRASDGELEWLGITRPTARASIDRVKVWTLMPARSVFIANWFVSEDHWREEGASLWIHENIESDEAREVALAVPELSAVDLARLTRPEACLTLAQIDRYPVAKILGR